MNAPIAGQIRKVSPAAARVIQLAARRQAKPATTRQPRESAFLRSLTTQERAIRNWIIEGSDPWDEAMVPVQTYYRLLDGCPLVEQAVRRWQGRLLLSRRGQL
jgi:hypothetical protein